MKSIISYRTSFSLIRSHLLSVTLLAGIHMLSPSMGHAANTCSKLFEIKKIAVNEMISQYQARYAIGKTMIDIWRQSHSQRRAVLFAARTKVAYSYQIDVPIIQQHGLESEFQYIATELFHFKKYLETGELRLVDGSKDSMRDAYRIGDDQFFRKPGDTKKMLEELILRQLELYTRVVDKPTIDSLEFLDLATAATWLRTIRINPIEARLSLFDPTAAPGQEAQLAYQAKKVHLDRHILLPVRAELNLRDFNDILPFPISPIGMIDSFIQYDGSLKFRPPYNYATHDRQHARTRRTVTPVPSKNIDLWLSRRINMATKFREFLERKTTQREKDILDGLWFTIFHEAVERGFEFSKKGLLEAIANKSLEQIPRLLLVTYSEMPELNQKPRPHEIDQAWSDLQQLAKQL